MYQKTNLLKGQVFLSAPSASAAISEGSEGM